MTVAIKGELYRSVTQELLDVLRVYAQREQQREARVPEVLPKYVWQVRAPEQGGQTGACALPTRRGALFDNAACFYLGISGGEFIERWDSGYYDEDSDDPNVVDVATLLPFAR